jgi:hypothetical protein
MLHRNGFGMTSLKNYIRLTVNREHQHGAKIGGGF